MTGPKFSGQRGDCSKEFQQGARSIPEAIARKKLHLKRDTDNEGV